jgi:GT2 family glycosyltransferase
MSSSPKTVINPAIVRPQVKGKFICAGDEKFYIRGVTYGPFCSRENGSEYGSREIVWRDFRRISAIGLNAIRTYTVPPRWLLDAAWQNGLWVMVGLPWQQHVTFLDDDEVIASIEKQVRDGIRNCASHKAVLCYAIGNEIPASILRWHGHGRVERLLKRLYRIAKAEDPEALVTYVNYPSTEYLHLPFVDFVCFNVYLESQENLRAYLGRLQNLAGDRPLVLAEIGLDSRRNGEVAQAQALDWQIRTAFASGCAGVFVFSWTDEWHRGGQQIEDWDFGITDRNRRPKPALASVRKAFAEAPFSPDTGWPRISVIACSYNGESRIRDCLEGLRKLEYVNYEVIVVDDGSTDRTAAIAREYGFQVISTENCGLSSARNKGLEAATGEIVAYIDDDAYPDPHWLNYLALAFMNSAHAGIAGPNISPPGDGFIADCVANAPGNPTHVLLSDQEAEHIPGCNMAFRKSCLQAIGGFDHQFRVAGDDVDLCWRLRRRGCTLGFSPAAVVWHHRRNRVRAYWKQQVGYGKAEALLERKWPEKYNAVGHVTWSGKVYNNAIMQVLARRGGRIYQGIWGNSLFQSMYEEAPMGLWSLTAMPEWYLLILSLACLSIFSVLWKPLLVALPLFLLAAGASIVHASLSAVQARFMYSNRSRAWRLALFAVTAYLCLLQPLARLFGRLRCGLVPWRWRGPRGFLLPKVRTFSIWSERWQAPDEWLTWLETTLGATRAVVLRGNEYDRWDLKVRGTFSSAYLLMAIEEHGAGRQMVRLRCWPKLSSAGLGPILLPTLLAIAAAFDQAQAACGLFALIALGFGLRVLCECAGIMAGISSTLRLVVVTRTVPVASASSSVQSATTAGD